VKFQVGKHTNYFASIKQKIDSL